MHHEEMLSQSAALLKASESTLQVFSAQDTFNDGNAFDGVLCNQAGHTYGALVIWKVNGFDVEPRRIFCTPKLYYPFTNTPSGERKYSFPKHKEVRVYEKLDGTNVCQFFYKDRDGNSFTTYKTRLNPVIENRSMKKFADLWKEILTAHPEIDNVPEEVRDQFSFSYELYGKRNLHLVWYDVDLAVRPIFSIRQTDAAIHAPDEKWGFKTGGEPVAICGADDDVAQLYVKMRDQVQQQSRKDGDYVVGGEGYVFYVLADADDRWRMYKCKSEMVENRHWVGEVIPRSIILPTVWNALETDDKLTRERIVGMLREEFEEPVVAKSIVEVDDCIREVQAKLAFREKVLKFYTEKGLDVNKDKREAMRCFAREFSKSEMQKVYVTLMELNLVNKPQ